MLQEAARLRQAGRLAQSLAPLQLAVRTNPTNAAAQHDLGLTLLYCGRPAEALPFFDSAALLKPDFAHAYLGRAKALEQLDDTTGAIAAYAQATRRAPDLAEAHGRLGVVLERAGRRHDAIAHYREAARTAPGTIMGRLGKARALVAEDRLGDAFDTLQASAKTDSGDAETRYLFATVLTSLGRFEEAEAEYDAALRIEPGNLLAYYQIARQRKITPRDQALIDRMLRAASAGPPDRFGVYVHFALGKAYDDLAEYEAAMRHFDTANAIRARTHRMDRASVTNCFDWLIGAITPETLRQHQAAGSTDRTPLLVLGMPRSGTTLAEQILSSHRDVAGGGELHFWNRRGSMLAADPATPPERFIAEVAPAYIKFLRAISPASARVTDKMPDNFIWTGLIHMAFPDATIFHCRRHPIDICLSMHGTYFAPRPWTPAGKADLVFYYREYARLMRHWRRVLPADRLIDIHYETLTADPEPTIRGMIAACGLDWDEFLPEA